MHLSLANRLPRAEGRRQWNVGVTYVPMRAKRSLHGFPDLIPSARTDSGVKELTSKVSEQYQERQQELERENTAMRKTLAVRRTQREPTDVKCSRIETNVLSFAELGGGINCAAQPRRCIGGVLPSSLANCRSYSVSHLLGHTGQSKRRSRRLSSRYVVCRTSGLTIKPPFMFCLRFTSLRRRTHRRRPLCAAVERIGFPDRVEPHGQDPDGAAANGSAAGRWRFACCASRCCATGANAAGAHRCRVRIGQV